MGKVIEQSQNSAWIHSQSQDSEWDFVYPAHSIRDMVVSENGLMLCGQHFISPAPRAWWAFLDFDGNFLWEMTSQIPNSSCSDIAQYGTAYLSTILQYQPTRTDSLLMLIDDSTEEFLMQFDNMEIMGLVTLANDVALSGFCYEDNGISGWIGKGHLEEIFEDSPVVVLDWEKRLSPQKVNKIKDLYLGDDGTLLGCGYSVPGTDVQNIDESLWDIWLLRWNWQGSILLNTIWGGEQQDGCKGFKWYANWGGVFVGDSRSFPQIEDVPNWDAIMGVVDLDGNVVKTFMIGESNDDYAYDTLIQDQDLWVMGTYGLVVDGEIRPSGFVQRESVQDVLSPLNEPESSIEEFSKNDRRCSFSFLGFLLLLIYRRK